MEYLESLEVEQLERRNCWGCLIGVVRLIAVRRLGFGMRYLAQSCYPRQNPVYVVRIDPLHNLFHLDHV